MQTFMLDLPPRRVKRGAAESNFTSAATTNGPRHATNPEPMRRPPHPVPAQLSKRASIVISVFNSLDTGQPCLALFASSSNFA